jgi:hypothetical protein
VPDLDVRRYTKVGTIACRFGVDMPLQLLNFKDLPLDADAPVAPIDAFLRTNRLLTEGQPARNGYHTAGNPQEME